MGNWTEKMREGMRLMKEACAANAEWDKCCNCPFDSYCDILIRDTLTKFDSKTGDDFEAELPYNWEV